MADLSHGLTPYAAGKSNRREYRVLITNNSAPAESRFSRGKSVSEFEEDGENSFSEALRNPPYDSIAAIASTLPKGKFFASRIRYLNTPIFLMHRQIVVWYDDMRTGFCNLILKYFFQYVLRLSQKQADDALRLE